MNTCKMADGGDEEMELYDNSDDDFESEEAGFEMVQMDQGMEDSQSSKSRGKNPKSMGAADVKNESQEATGKKKKKKKKKKKPKEGEEQEDKETKDEENNKEVFLPGDKMEEGEELTYDSTAYKMYHAAQTGSPCLSFDVIPDSLGESRTEFPMTAYIVAGTQAAVGQQNHVIVMKMSDLHETEQEDTADSDDDEYLDEEPDLETSMIKHDGGINRIRFAHIPNRHIVATWSEKSKVHIWDVSPQVIAVDNPTSPSQIKEIPPLFTFNGHLSEGFAMDWSRTVTGRLLTGDCKHNIHLWSPQEGGGWHIDQRPYNAHTDSVEDLQWSPNEQNVFASCSSDKTIRIWDARAAPSKACMLTTKAHDADVNVISWNRNEPFIVSGGDDGIIKIWDLRQFQTGDSVALFKHNTGPITSVEWHPTDSSVFTASSEDNQVTLWDLAVERDDIAEGPGHHLDVPPQLLFIHMGQKSVKEVHWHQQLPGVIISTAASGFNIFKTISI